MKARKYAFGGDVNASPDQAPPATYPFQSTPSTTINVGAQPSNLEQNMATTLDQYSKGGKVGCYAKGGVTRADGCAQRGKTRGRMV